MGKTYSGNRATFDICGVNLEETVAVHNALTFQGIPDVSSSIPTNKIAQKYGDLSYLKFPKLGSKVEDLLGLDVLSRPPVLESRLWPEGCHLTARKLIG